MSIVKEILRPLTEEGTALTREQSRAVLESMLAGTTPEIEAAAFLSALATRGELAPELAGFVDVMRAHSTPVPITAEERELLVDIVGTGGGRRTTFNISSGAAIVAAAAGAHVAKHGNRAVTSLVGSADVLEALGVPITLSPELAVECLRETGFVFFYAPLMHPAMKAVAGLRRALGLGAFMAMSVTPCCGWLRNRLPLASKLRHGRGLWGGLPRWATWRNPRRWRRWVSGVELARGTYNQPP